MNDRSLPVRGTAILLALTGALLLFRLGDVPLLGPDEPRYARVAAEMLQSGDWVTPTLQGEPWLEKPALYYWLAAASYSLLGETEAAARLPSVFSAVLAVGLTALFGARLYGSPTGLSAGFALGTAVLTFAYGRAAAMDMLLATLISAAIALIGLRTLGIAGPLAVPAGWACMGLATLAKGPLGLLLPLLVLLTWALASRDTRALRRVVTPGGVAAFLVVALPWHAAIVAEQGWRFVEVFLLDHNLLRFTAGLEEKHAHPGPPWFYVGVVLLGLFPWSALLLPGFGALRPRRDRADLFVLLWLLLPFAFFSVAGSKLPGYILPCLPPLAIVIGRGAVALATGRRLPRGVGARAAALLGLGLAAALLGLALKLVLGSAVGPRIFPESLYGQPGVRSLIPAALWAVVVAFAASRRIQRDATGALTLMRIGAAGFLVLLTLALPPLLGRLQSGRVLFLAARGRPVLAWGAWRTAWMSGYFYNDGRVAYAETRKEARRVIEGQPETLLLCGPAECAEVEADPGLETLRLAEGPRENALIRIRPAPSRPPAGDASASEPPSPPPWGSRTPPRP